MSDESNEDKLTVRYIVLAQPAMETIANKDLPQKPAWNLGTILDKLRAPLVRYGKQHNELVRKYGEVNKDGNFQVKKDAESQSAFEAEHEELLDAVVDINFNPVPLSLFKRKVKDKDGKPEEVEIELNGAMLGRAHRFFKNDVGL